MEGKESVDAKTLVQGDRFYPSCGKTREGIIVKATHERLSLFPSCAYFKKSRDTKISFAAQVRY
jgi:hypothetical protein